MKFARMFKVRVSNKMKGYGKGKLSDFEVNNNFSQN